MRFSRYLVVPAMLALSSAAMAGGFDGLSAKVDVGFSMAQTELKNYSPDGKVSDDTVVGGLSLNYSQSFGTFNLAAGVFTSLGKQKSGSLDSFQGGQFGTGGVWQDEFKLKNIFGLSIEPGIYLNPNTLVYSKLSYVRATGENTWNYPQEDDAGTETAKHHGYGIGFGAKLKLSNNVFGTVEFEQIKFNDKKYHSDVVESYKPSIIKGSVGLGYQF